MAAGLWKPFLTDSGLLLCKSPTLPYESQVLSFVPNPFQALSPPKRKQALQGTRVEDVGLHAVAPADPLRPVNTDGSATGRHTMEMNSVGTVESATGSKCRSRNPNQTRRNTNLTGGSVVRQTPKRTTETSD